MARVKSKEIYAESFIRKATRVHNNKYDYSKINYVNSRTKVTIICPIHGDFEQKAADHLYGKGCLLCANNISSSFEKKARETHGNKYDYSKVDYVNSQTKITIICPEHGEFEQIPNNHTTKGNGCLKCAIRDRTSTSDDFIKKAKKIHGDKYNYSKVDYEGRNNKVTIICPAHGEFEQTPTHHLYGQGCPSCPAMISSGHQKIIDHIESFGFEIKINDRTQINPYELDIYIPDKRVAIEYHGLYWHSYDRQETTEEKCRHRNKLERCINNNIRLIQIFENEWIDKRDVVKSILKSKLGISDRIFARRCGIKEINNQEYKDFINKSHLQGYKSSSIKLGLFYEDKLVSIMSFNKHPKYGWEITRFASKLGYTIVGGASKLFKYFVKNYDPKQVMTYADRRYSDGNLYKKLGFELDGVTQPNYFYIKRGIFSRQQFQKHKLKDKLEQFDPNLTESQNMFNNGYRRIWDAGHYRFIYPIQLYLLQP